MAHWAVQIYLEAEVDNHNIREIQASSPMDQKRAACVNLRVWKGCPTMKMWPRKPLPTSYRGFDIYSGYGVGKSHKEIGTPGCATRGCRFLVYATFMSKDLAEKLSSKWSNPCRTSVTFQR